MNCMKCGRETKGDAVFCEDCLEHMDRHPVTANVLVYVPSEKDRAAAAKKHTTTHAVVSSEDQVKKLKQEVEVLRLLVIIFIMLSLFFGIFSMDTLSKLKVSKLQGKNYTTVTTTEAVD